MLSETGALIGARCGTDYAGRLAGDQAFADLMLWGRCVVPTLPRLDSFSTCPTGSVAAGVLDFRLLGFGRANEKGLTFSRKALIYLQFFGSSTWARTRDLRINSPTLYQSSRHGRYLGKCG